MKGSAAKIQMTSLDELFGGSTTQVPTDQIQEIPLTELYSFKDHPFHVVDDEKMQEMAESVAQYGVLVPGIVRPRSEGGYEIVAGHRRKRASELAGKSTMRDPFWRGKRRGYFMILSRREGCFFAGRTKGS